MVVARIEHRDHVGVLEPAGGAGLLREAGADMLVRDLVSDNFDRQLAPEYRVDGQIEPTHTALTEEPLDLVASDLLGKILRVRHHSGAASPCVAGL